MLRYMTLSKLHGFTLMELIVTLGIVSIIASVAAPNVQNWSKNYYVKSAVTDLYTNINAAKMGAIRANKSWELIFTPTGYEIRDDVGGVGRVVRTVNVTNSYGRAVQFKHPRTAGLAYDRDRLRFRPNGLVTDSANAPLTANNPGTAYLAHKDGTAYYRVGMLFGGASAKIWKWNASTWE